MAPMIGLGRERPVAYRAVRGPPQPLEQLDPRILHVRKHDFYGDFFLARSMSQHGLALARLGQLESAERICREALEAVARSPRHHGHVRAALGLVLRLQGKLDQAAEILLPYLEEDLGDSSFAVEVVRVLIERGETTRARQIFRDAIRLQGAEVLPSWQEFEEGLSADR